MQAGPASDAAVAAGMPPPPAAACAKRPTDCVWSPCGDAAPALWTEYLFYHPILRVLVALAICGFDFWVYAEDPVAHSHSEATLPVVGLAWELLFMRYPPGWRTAVKVFWAVAWLWAGLTVGRNVLHHAILRDFLKLEMFGWRATDEDDLLASRKKASERDEGGHGCPLRCTHPFPADGRTERNKAWWWADPKEEVGKRYFHVKCPDADDAEAWKDELAMSRRATTKFGDLIHAEGHGRCERVEEGWRTREEYQGAGETEPVQTAVEVCFPRLCHPKKHQGATKGTWLVMFASSIVSLAMGAALWNPIWLGPVDDRDRWQLGNGLGMKNRLFLKMAGTGTWCADLLTVVMVVDGVLQEVARHRAAMREEPDPVADDELAAVAARHRTRRPGWLLAELEAGSDAVGDDAEERETLRRVLRRLQQPARRLKMGYLTGCWRGCAEAWGRRLCGPVTVRIAAVWAVFLGVSLVVMVGFWADLFKWDEWAKDFNGTSESDRATLAAWVYVFDLTVVMHDWEFPAFDTAQDIKFPGFDCSEIDLGCARASVEQEGRDGEPVRTATGGRPRLSLCRVFATGKWFNYGILFLVMGFDINMMKNQIIYEPAAFGQYVVPKDPSLCITPELQALHHRECHTGRICWISDREEADDLVGLWAAEKDISDEEGREPVHPFEFSYAVRNGTRPADECMPSRYDMQPKGTRLWAITPALLAAALFPLVIWSYTKHDEQIRRAEPASPRARRSADSRRQRGASLADGDGGEGEPAFVGGGGGGGDQPTGVDGGGPADDEANMVERSQITRAQTGCTDLQAPGLAGHATAYSYSEPAPGPGAGARMVAAEDATVFRDPHSWDAVGQLQKGEAVTIAGEESFVDGYRKKSLDAMARIPIAAPIVGAVERTVLRYPEYE